MKIYEEPEIDIINLLSNDPTADSGLGDGGSDV